MAQDYVITVATHDEGYIAYFKQSCKRHGIDPIILGQGDEWKGFGTKFQIIRDWVMTIPDDSVVLLVDCYDLIFLRPLETLFAFYRTKANKTKAEEYIYVSTEPQLWGLSDLSKLYYGSCNGSVINTGSVMAFAKVFKNMFSDPVITAKLARNELSDDQQMFNEYVQKNNTLECEMDDNRRFLVYQTLRLDIGLKCQVQEDGTFIYRDNDQAYEPYLLHRNGNGKMLPILQRLGYDTSAEPVGSRYHERILTNHVPHLLQSIRRHITGE